MQDRPPVVPADLPALAQRVRGLLATAESRVVVGVTGAPGAGKSTLAAALVDAFGNDAVLCPMDGFHLSNHVLHELGRRDRKGAPDTFDAAGYAHLLGRIRDHAEDVYAPGFDRTLEEPVAASVRVAADVPIVVTEGNYLLVDDGSWARVRPLLDEVWYVEVDDDVRVERLVRRHEEFGKAPDAARRWATGSDERNAEVVRATRPRADVIVRTDVAP